MHATTLNLGDLLLPLWQGTMACSGSDHIADWPWVVFSKQADWNDHGLLVANARPYIPGSFDRPPRNIAQKINSRYKAKEWQGYLFGLAPALLHGILPFPYWQNFCRLVFAVRISLQQSISRLQLSSAQEAMDKFAIEYEELYVRRRADRLHFVRPVIHAMIHLPLQVAVLGPPGLYSSWTMERAIGDLGGEICQPSNPYANLSERGLICSQVNALKTMVPSIDKDSDKVPRGAWDLGDGYFLLKAQEPSETYCSASESRAIRMFGCEGSLDDDPANSEKYKVRRWARVRLPTGQVARSAWKETLKPIDKLRRARCVKVNIY